MLNLVDIGSECPKCGAFVFNIVAGSVSPCVLCGWCDRCSKTFSLGTGHLHCAKCGDAEGHQMRPATREERTPDYAEDVAGMDCLATVCGKCDAVLGVARISFGDYLPGRHA